MVDVPAEPVEAGAAAVAAGAAAEVAVDDGAGFDDSVAHDGVDMALSRRRVQS